MAASTGIGLPISGTSQPGTGTALGFNLQEGEVPVFRSSTQSLEPSGFVINPVTRALRGTTDIETSASVEAGVATFRLRRAHEITSAAENVTFRNRVTNRTFHPTWQTSEDTGDWASVQRTPVGNLVTDFEFQAVADTEITNPAFMFTSLPVNNRLYRVMVNPVNSVSGVVVLLQQNNGIEFVDYWRSQPLSFIADTPVDVAINPFIDLFASTEYRLSVESPNGDAIVRGNSAGIPQLIIDYRAWEDRPLVTTTALQEAIQNLPTTGNGSSTFLGLSDTPQTYTANQFLRANAEGDGLEFATLADNFADSLNASVSGNELTITIGRTGTLPDVSTTVTLPTGSGPPTPTDGPSVLYFGLSDTNAPATVPVSGLTMIDPVDPQSISTGAATLGQFFIILTPSTHDITSIRDTVLSSEVTTIFTRTAGVRTEAGTQLNSYVIGPVNSGFNEQYVLRFS